MADDRVHITLQDGTVGTVPKDGVDAALAAGARMATQGEIDSKKSFSQRAADHFTQKAEAIPAQALGVLRGASMGISDRLPLEAADVFGKKEQVRTYLNEQRDKHKVDTAEAETMGTILPSLFGEPTPKGGAAAALQEGISNAPRKIATVIEGAHPTPLEPAGLPEKGPLITPETGPPVGAEKFDQRPSAHAATPAEPKRADVDVDWDQPDAAARREWRMQPTPAEAPFEVPAAKRAGPGSAPEPLPGTGDLGEATNPGGAVKRGAFVNAREEAANPWKGDLNRGPVKIFPPKTTMGNLDEAAPRELRFDGESRMPSAEPTRGGAGAAHSPLDLEPTSPGGVGDARDTSGWWKDINAESEPDRLARQFAEQPQGRELTKPGMGRPPEPLPETLDTPRLDAIEKSELGKRPLPSLEELLTNREGSGVRARPDLLTGEPANVQEPLGTGDAMNDNEVTRMGPTEPTLPGGLREARDVHEPTLPGGATTPEQAHLPFQEAEVTKPYPKGAASFGDPDVNPFEPTRWGKRPAQPGTESPFMGGSDAYAPEPQIMADTPIGKAAGATPQRSALVNALPANVVTQIGDAVEREMLRTMGPEARSVLGRMVQEGSNLGVRGAAEGALFGAAQYLDEAALGDEKVTAAKLLAAVGHGQLWGGAAGAGLGAGGVLTRKVAGQLAMSLERQKGQQAWRALLSGSNKRATRAADGIPGGTEAIGNFLLKKGLIQANDNVERIAPRVASAVDETVDRMATILDAHDAAGLGGAHLNEGIFMRLQKEKAALSKMPEMNAGAIHSLEKVQSDMMAMYEGKGHLSFGDAWALRKRVDQEINFNVTPWAKHNPTADALRKARSVIEEEVEGAIEKSGSGLGPAYKEAKLEFRMLRVSERTLQDSLIARQTNRKLSLTDYLAGMGAAAAGHPIVGMIAGAAHHVVKDRGNATVAALLDKMSTIEGLRRASAHVDRQIGRGVSAIFGRNRAEMVLKDPVLRGDHDARVAAVAKAITDGSHMDAIEAAVAPIMQHAPEVGSQFLQNATRVTQYLAMKLPQEPVSQSLTPQHEKMEWNDMEKADFARAVDIAHDPVSILADINRGDVTEDQVEAIRTMYPPLYEEMKQELEHELAQAQPGEIPYDKQLSIGIFMQHPDPTLDASFIAMLQNAFPPAAKYQGGTPKKRRGSKMANKDFGFSSFESLSSETDNLQELK